MKTIVSIAISVFILVSMNTKAQVTIGCCPVDPVKGALLDLKDHANSADSTTTSSGGLGLPCVKLVNKKTLEPFISLTASEWSTTNRAKTSVERIGLMVYNLTNNGDFSPGIFIWRGSSWEQLALASNYVYTPSFNVTWIGNGSGTINLYDIYKKNFNPATTTNYISSRGVGQPPISFPDFESNPENFYYVVSYYDPAVYTISSITAQGVLNYSCLGATPSNPKNLRINVVMIKKL